MAKTIYAEDTTIDYVILNAKGSASTSTTFNLFPRFYDAYPLYIMARVKIAFSGTVTNPTVKLGDGTDDDCYMKDQPIGRAGDLICGGQPNALGYCEKMFIDWRKSYTTSAQTAIVATFTSASGNFGALTTGEIEFVFVYAK